MKSPPILDSPVGPHSVSYWGSGARGHGECHVLMVFLSARSPCIDMDVYLTIPERANWREEWGWNRLRQTRRKEFSIWPAWLLLEALQPAPKLSCCCGFSIFCFKRQKQQRFGFCNDATFHDLTWSSFEA